MKEHLVIYEPGEAGEESWGAYVPDLPGCITTGDTLEETRRNIREAIELRGEGLKAEGLPILEPSIQVDRIAVAASPPPRYLPKWYRSSRLDSPLPCAARVWPYQSGTVWPGIQAFVRLIAQSTQSQAQ